MDSRRISWFWPLSFLAALGQLLLLLTDNRGGPAPGRMALALWTLWIPGVWLGNLLTKPGTGLPARLALQAVAGVAIAFLLLLVRALGWIEPHHIPYAISGIGVLIGLVFLFIPDSPSPRRLARWEAQELARAEPATTTTFVLVLVLIGALQLWAGSPLSLRPDAADHVASARASAEALFPAPVYDPGLGGAHYDAHRGLTHGFLDVVARLSQVPHHTVWDLLPSVAAPLLLLAVFALGRSLFRDEGRAILAVMAFLFLATAGLSNDFLRTTGFPDRMALIPFFLALALFIEGLDRPHPRLAVALALATFVTLGTHMGMGFALLVSMLAVGTFTWTSVDRFAEGAPLLAVLWVPSLLLCGLYLGVRVSVLGALDPSLTPARDLLVVEPGLWTLDPTALNRSVLAAGIVACLFLPVLLSQAWERVTTYALVVLTVVAVALTMNPWGTPRLESAIGSWIHLIPWMAPVPFLLVALGQWAVMGLARSQEMIWLRFLVLGVLVGLLGGLVIAGVRNPAYAPGRVSAQRAAPPAAELAAALTDTVAWGTSIVVVPGRAIDVAARSPLRDATRPGPRGGLTEALRRWTWSERVLREIVRETGHDDSLTSAPTDRAHQLTGVLSRLGATAMVVSTRPDTPTSRSARAELRALPGFRELALPPWGSVFQWDGTGGAPATPAPPLMGADRPPASTLETVPASTPLAFDRVSVAAGDTLLLEMNWIFPEDRVADPRGYRVRLEFDSTDPRTGLARIAHLPEALATRLGGTWSRHAVEAPIRGEGRMRLRVPIPRDLAAGSYAVRMAALPGRHGADRVRRGLLFLPQTPVTPHLSVTGTP